MSAYDPNVLLERIAGLERRVTKANERFYDMRRSRDRWKALAMERATDARLWRRWRASA